MMVCFLNIFNQKGGGGGIRENKKINRRKYFRENMLKKTKLFMKTSEENITTMAGGHSRLQKLKTGQNF